MTPSKKIAKLIQQQFEGSLLERQALTGQEIDDSEAIMDALARSNKLYAMGIDNHRLHWLLEGISSGRIDASTPLERATDEAGEALNQARDEEQRERQKGGR